MDTKSHFRHMVLTWVLSVSVLLLLIFPAIAAPGIEVLAKHTKALSRGIRETRYVIGLAGRSEFSASDRNNASVSLTFSWSSDLGQPEIFTNWDRTLMAIQTMPYWHNTGRARFGRRICLLVSTPKSGIKVIQDFSMRLNRLRLANVSRWDHLSGHYYRPSSTIFLTAQSMKEREIYANQYAIDPKVGLPEYNTLGAKVNMDGGLSFVCFTSQGF